MVHLLLDGFDGFFSSLGDVFPSVSSLTSNYLEPIFSFLMRIIWYPLISFHFLSQYIFSSGKERDVDSVWRWMVFVWCVIANVIHYVILFQKVKTRFFTKKKETREGKTE